MTSRKSWPVALTGIAAIVIGVVSGAVAGSSPDASDDSPREIVRFYTEHDTRVAVSVGIGIVAVALLLFFASYLKQVLDEAGAERSILPRVAFAGAVVLATGLAIDATIQLTLIQTADDISLAGSQALNALYNNDYVPLGVGMALLVFSAGLSIVKHGGLPKWIGWVGIVFGLTAPTPVGFIAFVGGGLWIAVTSVVLALRARKAVDGGDAAPAAAAAR